LAIIVELRNQIICEPLHITRAVNPRKELLSAKGVTQAKLSRAADIPTTTVRRLVHDEKYQPTLGTLDKVAKYLGVMVDDLYYDDGKPEDEEAPKPE
jgi:transcriptional regulator with XRE-family HTH domain